MTSSSQALRPLPRQGLWVILRALSEVLGEEEFHKVLARAGLPALYANLAGQGREWPEATHNMTGSVTRAVFDLYPGKAEEYLMTAGRAQFRHARENLPMHINMLQGMLKALPRDVRMKMVLEQGARDLARSSNCLPVISGTASEFVITDVVSPTCAGQTAKFPMCITRIGLLTAAMEWATGDTDVKISETHCRAMGAPECRFVIQKRF